MSPIDIIGKVDPGKTRGQAFKKGYFDQDVIPALKNLVKDQKQIKYIDKHFGRLIEARGRCILGLLKEAHEG